MHRIKNTVVAVVGAAALSLVAACGEDLEAPANDIGNTVEKKSEGPAPKAPVRTNPNRMDFGDGKATLPAKPKSKTWTDRNRSRLDFGDTGRS